MIDINELAQPLAALPRVISEVSASIESFADNYVKSAIGRHRGIAGLLSVTDEKGVKDDYIREILANMAVEDGDVYDKLEEMKTEARVAIAAVVAARKDIATLGERYASHIQRMCEENRVAELRVRELAARLREHATNDPAIRAQVWAITDGKCFYCEVALVRGENISPADQRRLFHVDHLVPKTLGGPDHIANYVPACHSCNSSKHARHFAEFVMSQKAKQEQPQLTVIEGGAVA